MSDILLALESGNLALLNLLDLSAAFDSVDHVTLLRRLQKSYGLGSSVIRYVYPAMGVALYRRGVMDNLAR